MIKSWVRTVPNRHSFWGEVRVDAECSKSPTARRSLLYWGDLRPAWLWSHDGSTLIWRNAAARYFTAKVKKTGLRLGDIAVPIRGQVARLIRLGTPGRSSRSRVQFLAGEKPLAETCSCTPLALPDGQMALLLVALDPIAADVLEAAGPLRDDWAVTSILPAGSDFLLLDGQTILRGSESAIAAHGAEIANGAPVDENGEVLQIKASTGETTLLVFPPNRAEQPTIAEGRAEDGETAEDSEIDLANTPEPMLPLGLEALPQGDVPVPHEEWVDPLPAGEPDRALSSLFDRLAEDAPLYTALSPSDEVFAAPPTDPPGDAIAPAVSDDAPAAQPDAPPQEESELDHQLVSAVIEFADDPEHADAVSAETPAEAQAEVVQPPADEIPPVAEALVT